MTTEERTIKGKRRCKNGCGTEIYLQYIPVTKTLRWLAFDITDGRLHSCPNRPLDFKTKKLIASPIERMSYSSSNATNISPLLDKIDTIVDELKGLKNGLIRMTKKRKRAAASLTHRGTHTMFASLIIT